MKRKVNQKSLKNLTKGRQSINLPVNELLAAKKEGLSYGQMAIKFNVSVSTIKNKLRNASLTIKDPNILSFAERIELLACDAPDQFCKKELMRTVNFLRTRMSLSDENKKQKIIETFDASEMPKEEWEIACDTGFPTAVVIKLISELIKEKKLVRVSRGGVFNRGRKQKYLYVLPKHSSEIKEKIAAQQLKISREKVPTISQEVPRSEVNETLLNQTQALQFFNVTKKTLQKYRKQYGLKSYMVGNRILFSYEKHILPFLEKISEK